MNSLGLLARVPLYTAFRRFGRPRLLPFSLVISVCYRCNSRCRTCNVWQKDAQELTLEEWDRIFARLGPHVYYLTATGGEPFLRKDLVEIIASAHKHCRPAVITVPTNGLLSDAIPQRVEEMLHAAPGSKIGVNVSLDDVGEEHDAIRGVPGNWKRAVETYHALKRIAHPNLTVSVHTVLSRYNIDRAEAIFDGLAELEPDSYITEVAEERVELGTVGAGVTPGPEAYAHAVCALKARLAARPFRGLARITQAFRTQYYDFASRTLAEHRQMIPCYAGWASGHIAPDGDVWGCCIRAEPIGNLRETGYDLRPIWFGERADALRRSVRAGACFCPMANAAYTNMFLHLPTLARVALKALA